jgi:methanogenic corrinoid protein MtbC1
VAEGLLRPAASAIGERWHVGAISVAEEHRATALLERDLAELHRLVPWRPAVGRVLVIGCIAGELHALGCRLVADHFERSGWTVHYLGADVPIPAFLTLAQAAAADLLGVSATLPEHVPAIATLIQAQHKRGEQRPVLVGGQPFERDPHLAQVLGAWAQASTAAEAVYRATAQFAARPDSGAPADDGLTCPGGDAHPSP